MIRLLILYLVVFTSPVVAQQVSDRYFRNSEWFTANRDSALFKADTVRLIRYPVCKNPDKIHSIREDKYLGHGDFAVLHFDRRHRMFYSERYNNYTSVAYGGYFSWHYTRETNDLIVMRESKLFLALKPIEISPVFVLCGTDSLRTVELVCLRLR